uniref:Secreted protein n=1 Tax=Panagrellus redivivus TaxID=6233 RepID=A0A7E4V915_PANRE
MGAWWYLLFLVTVLVTVNYSEESDSSANKHRSSGLIHASPNATSPSWGERPSSYVIRWHSDQSIQNTDPATRLNDTVSPMDALLNLCEGRSGQSDDDAFSDVHLRQASPAAEVALIRCPSYQINLTMMAARPRLNPRGGHHHSNDPICLEATSGVVVVVHDAPVFCHMILKQKIVSRIAYISFFCRGAIGSALLCP